MNFSPEHSHTLSIEWSRLRRRMASASPTDFGRIYLPETFHAPPCRLHTELGQRLEAMVVKRAAHLAVAAPRGHAKSSLVSLAYVLWCALYLKERYILLVSATAEQAERLLDHVRREVESNALLRLDFPELSRGRASRPWKTKAIRLPSDSLISVASAGQSLRGIRYKQFRPTLIVCDDLEDKAQAASQEQRAKLADWFTSTLVKAGTPETNVVVVGTLFHHDSLLANLLKDSESACWDRLTYRAIERPSDRPELWEQWARIHRGQEKFNDRERADGAEAFYKEHAALMNEGAQVLWSPRVDYKQLMEIRLREGEASFLAEFQNQPLDPEQCIFAAAPIRYWSDEFAGPQELIAALSKTGTVQCFGACDPSLGGTGGDFSAIVIVAKHYPSRAKYVLAADLKRRGPDATLEAIINLCDVYQVRRFAFENNQFQQLMEKQLRERIKRAGLPTRVVGCTHGSVKNARIAGLEPLVSQGLVHFSRQHQLLLEQLREFPMGKHDDGPDALEMAISEADAIDLDPNRPKGKIGTGDGYFLGWNRL